MDKIYTYLSESHQYLYQQYFLKSFDQHLKNDFELYVDTRPQIVTNGEYFAHGWTEMMQQKVEILIQAVNKNDYFVYADVDILFCDNFIHDFEDFKKSGLDIQFQSNFKNDISLCAGFFYCKSTNAVKKFFEQVYKDTIKYKDDQHAMNMNKHMVSYGVLPETYWSYGYMKNGIWDNETFNFDVPENLKIVHANFIIGTKNKIALLEHFI
jgi:hypothetical protein